MNGRFLRSTYGAVSYTHLIATANNKDQISAPLMSRFAVIDIPDYTKEEKKIIFTKFSLPKVCLLYTSRCV